MTENTAPEEEVQDDDQPHPWADLPPEHFRLLRLAPLQTDRHTGVRPLRFIQLGRVERHDKRESLLRLTLHLPGQQVHKEQNVLEVWANHIQRKIYFGPEEGLRVEPANRGLGRFLLAQGADWARLHYSHYQVATQALQSKDAPTDEDRARRDHCLKAQGFEIEFTDPLQMKAQCVAARASALHSDWNSEKVQILDLLDAANMLQQADQNLREQEVKVRKLEEQVDRYKREDGGLRFTITCLLVFCVFQAALLIWMATR
jgi:hypothetical protein